MLSYAFLEDAYRAVLAKSQAIQGRFHVCPLNGVEIQMDRFNEVLVKMFESQTNDQRYPAALWMPPQSTGTFGKEEQWERFNNSILFLKTSYVTSGNQPQNPNTNTRTSMHTISQDWHDMHRAAISFMRAFDQLTRSQSLNLLRLAPRQQNRILPVSLVGGDQLSGVKLDFGVDVFIGCEIEDYTTDDLKLITLPTTDSHPKHPL